jgi:hypothetical protein
VRLTDLGRAVVDPEQEPWARAEAFQRVPLFNAIYERYKGFKLAGSSGIESEINTLGVSSKQTDKARQALMRSARQRWDFLLPLMRESPARSPERGSCLITYSGAFRSFGTPRQGHSSFYSSTIGSQSASPRSLRCSLMGIPFRTWAVCAFRVTVRVDFDQRT